MEDHEPPSEEIRRKLELNTSKLKRWLKRFVVLLVLGGLFAAGWVWRARRKAAGAPRYKTEEIQRGDLRLTVSATGNLKGLDTVVVGAEVSGRILVVKVDYNDSVKKGQVLAEIDTEQLRANVEQAAAQLNSAIAQVKSAKATARETRLKAKRAKELAASGLISKQQLETAIAAAERADASVGTARAQAVVANASLKSARTSRRKARVLSPIDGVVLARHIEQGQTVAAGFQTPVLFTLAKDLKKMVLHVDVDEADIGLVRDGQPATFTVDAYPDKTFPAKLDSVRNIPKTEQKVVTYEAVLSLKNDALLLRPGMTATATIVTAEKKDVLLVPNAALRFTPPKVARERSSKRGFRLGGGRRKRSGGGRASPSASVSTSSRKSRDKRKVVWLPAEPEPKQLRLHIGSTDGRFSEILDDKLTVGAQVIIDVEAEEK